MSQLRHKISIAVVRGQCISLHGRLELIGMGLSESETSARIAGTQAMAHAMERDTLTFLHTLRTPQHGVQRGFGREVNQPTISPKQLRFAE